ncbi:hypothetical protein PR202_gb01851 [Eleusine coracana subsp. coracana]|uniref:DUF4005 domain-containing protein n=1 Tax=Eleusine coracana subsp. coracana TaxID=191504 RepID=A0AAV5DV77_ELECO|nr:hypothetical protein PR202_gb01851 [Eleusine coracana subsp. coracana]
MSLPVVHRRRLSDGGDSAFERCSPRIVEMDTCHLRCRSTRITTTRYAADPPPPPSASPLLYFYSHKQAAARLLEREREPPLPKTTHNTPRLGSAFPSGGGGLGYLGSPAKGGTSPRYMADTASSVARSARCQSAPRQRNGEQRHSLGRSGSRKKQQQEARAMSQQDSFSFKSCSEATSRVEGSEFSDEVTRDYYLDRLW